MVVTNIKTEHAIQVNPFFNPGFLIFRVEQQEDSTQVDRVATQLSLDGCQGVGTAMWLTTFAQMQSVAGIDSRFSAVVRAIAEATP